MEEASVFYGLANDYCCYFKEEVRLDSIPFLIEILMKLYVCAMKLPEAEPQPKDFKSASATKPPIIKINKQVETTYWEVFDPFHQEEPVCCSLLDDLSDIYADLQRGMIEYREGRTQNAVWEWKFGLSNHWGNHVVDVLRALNRLKAY